MISSNCSGCRACEQSCHKKAITMKEDVEGFRYPVIDQELCVHCGICSSICPQNSEVMISNKLTAHPAFAAQLKDRQALSRSTSGGFFFALAQEVITEGGVVFGVRMEEHQHAVYCEVTCAKQLHEIQGSKYVASDTLNSYAKVKEHLLDGRYVLFSGCPCQVAGLRAYLRKDYDKLLTADVVCHGTPSQKLFDVYCAGASVLEHAHIYDFVFRNKKKYGWGVYWSYRINNKQRNGGLHDNPYISAFIDGAANRECCYQCRYIGLVNRVGDFTLGDYWGVDEIHPEMASNGGVSAVIVNTEKGLEWCDRALVHCKYEKSDANCIAKYNPSLVETHDRPEKRNNIYCGIDEKKPGQFVVENLHIQLKRVLRTKLRLAIPYRVRVFIKKIKNLKHI